MRRTRYKIICDEKMVHHMPVYLPLWPSFRSVIERNAEWTVHGRKLKDVYYLEFKPNPICDNSWLATRFTECFRGVKVIYASSTIDGNTLPAGTELVEYCQKVTTCLTSWPGKVVVICSPLMCLEYMAGTSNPYGCSAEIYKHLRPRKRVWLDITQRDYATTTTTTTECKHRSLDTSSSDTAVYRSQGSPLCITNTLRNIGVKEFHLKHTEPTQWKHLREVQLRKR